MTKRGIASVVILTLVTCGIYSFVWMAAVQNELNNLDGDKTTGGGKVVLLSITTCGIYTFVWMWRTNKRLVKFGANDNGALIVVLSIFVTPIVGMALIQSAANGLSNGTPNNNQSNVQGFR